LTGNYNKFTKQDIKIDHARLQQIKIEADLQLVATKISLVTYLAQHYGDLPEAKQRWIDALKLMREHDFPLLVQAEAVKLILKDLGVE